VRFNKGEKFLFAEKLYAIDDLSVELLVKIFEFADRSDLSAFACVSKTWQTAASKRMKALFIETERAKKTKKAKKTKSTARKPKKSPRATQVLYFCLSLVTLATGPLTRVHMKQNH